ncbi:MAG: hypothetical protein AB7C90_05140 [Bacteroidales bacterium]
MARKITFSNLQRKRFGHGELTRKVSIRNKRKYYLIVCEGEAKRLAKRFDGRKDYANHNPCTMVSALVEELMLLKE